MQRTKKPNEKTAKSLKQIAKKIFEDYGVDIIDTENFWKLCCEVSSKTNSGISQTSIFNHQSSIVDIIKRLSRESVLEEEKREEERIESDPFEFENVADYQPSKNLVATINFYDDGTFEKISHRVNSKPPAPKPSIPNYSMFVEIDGELVVIKGGYKGKTIKQIDSNFTGCAAGWSKWMLKEDNDLTEDDRSVFRRIIGGHL